MSNIQPIDQLKQVISSDGMKAQIKAALPAHVTVEKFNRVVMTALSNTPALVSCDRNSLFSSMLKAAADGLLPDGREAAIIPYGSQAQYQPMFAGILKKMRNSGELKSIQTQIIYRNDKFRYWFDESGEHLTFEPDMFADRGEPIGVFSIGLTKDGGQYIDVMTKADVEKVKASSKSAKSGSSPWTGAFFLEMWKKTSIRRIAKKMPSSTDLDNVFASDDGDYEFETKAQEPEPEKSPSVQKGKKKSRMENIVVPDEANDASPDENQDQPITVSADQLPI